MTHARPVYCFAACLLLALSSHAQQTSANPGPAACGPPHVDYTVKRAPSASSPMQAPPDKALVYVIEAMPHYPIFTQKVNMGLDGKWLGATDTQSHISFTLDPGVHHLCAVYQGKAQFMDPEGKTLLLRLDAQPGHTYYLRYHAIFLKDSPGIAFFDKVDEDEGSFLVQSTAEATSALKN